MNIGRKFRVGVRRYLAITAVLFVAFSASSQAALDLRNAVRHELDNGLEVLLLVDRSFPVVSVQMLYRVGARNEQTGKTGLAHFAEHMAFRATERFPDTEVVSRIYAVGGEWHGYTWTDQTTYFATVPRQYWPLLLEIEADRMARLIIDPAAIDAERGAVLAEMHQYELDPDALLVDAVAFVSFIAHPYRNNTIGLESDVVSITHEDVRSFYDAHYHPSNAVLAVVGDIDPDAVLARIESLFGEMPKRSRTPLPHTVEPEQDGERRIVVRGDAPGRRFRIGYRAPGVNHPDYAAFLVTQEILAGGSGVSFLQNDWGTSARPSRLLHGAAATVSTWYPPSAQDYLFTISGSPTDEQSELDAEQAIDARISTLRESTPTDSEVREAIDRVRDELVFDVQTTEDAAHQLAFFAGMGALETLWTLHERVGGVSGEDVARVVDTYLRPEQRTIAWYLPGRKPAPVREAASDVPAVAESTREPPAKSPSDESAAGGSELITLEGGLPAILVPSRLSPTVALKLVVRGTAAGSDEFAIDDPDPGFASWFGQARSGELDALIDRSADALATARRTAGSGLPPGPSDPGERMQQVFRELMAIPVVGAESKPVLVVVAGDFDASLAGSKLEDALGGFAAPAPRAVPRLPDPPTGTRGLVLGQPVAQSRLGYAVVAPGPDDDDYHAWRILQYLFAHDYEGRFGKAAISERGLAYYVDARYAPAAGRGWSLFDVGVDTSKVEALAALLREELERLADEPPTEMEVREAKQHLVGRAISAAQSNGELASDAARRFVRHGDLASPAELERQLKDVSVRDVRGLVPEFANGLVITITP